MSRSDNGDTRQSPREELPPATERKPSECPFIPQKSAGVADSERLAEEPKSVEMEEQATEEAMARLREMLTELEQKCAFAEDQHLRVVAELQNYKRRVQQEKEQLVRFAVEGIVAELIPILDNFERAMAVEIDSPGAECLMAGVRMIYDQVQNVLANHGVKQIEAVGQEFDPHFHEAVERVESAELAPNTVVGEVAKGYLLNGRLLRPAKVRVTVRPEEA